MASKKDSIMARVKWEHVCKRYEHYKLVEEDTNVFVWNNYVCLNNVPDGYAKREGILEKSLVFCPKSPMREKMIERQRLSTEATIERQLIRKIDSKVW